jgi:hypothetical protein
VKFEFYFFQIGRMTEKTAERDKFHQIDVSFPPKRDIIFNRVMICYGITHDKNLVLDFVNEIIGELRKKFTYSEKNCAVSKYIIKGGILYKLFNEVCEYDYKYASFVGTLYDFIKYKLNDDDYTLIMSVSSSDGYQEIDSEKINTSQLELMKTGSIMLSIFVD